MQRAGPPSKVPQPLGKGHGPHGSGIIGGSGLLIDRANTDPSYRSQWRMRSGCWCRNYTLVGLCQHNITHPVGDCTLGVLSLGHVRAHESAGLLQGGACLITTPDMDVIR
jgi:hypothetical protein